jgi:hypothetical protein
VKEEVRCDDERLWQLLGDMVKDKVVNVWKHTASQGMGTFMNVAAAGWFMFKVRANKQIIELTFHYLEEVQC